MRPGRLYSGPLPENPVHGIPQGGQQLLLSNKVGARLEAVVSIDPSPSGGPSFPTVEMVCKMLLGDAEVFKWLLVSSFKGPFPGPGMEQLAGGF